MRTNKDPKHKEIETMCTQMIEALKREQSELIERKVNAVKEDLDRLEEYVRSIAENVDSKLQTNTFTKQQGFHYLLFEI